MRHRNCDCARALPPVPPMCVNARGGGTADEGTYNHDPDDFRLFQGRHLAQLRIQLAPIATSPVLAVTLRRVASSVPVEVRLSWRSILAAPSSLRLEVPSYRPRNYVILARRQKV